MSSITFQSNQKNHGLQLTMDYIYPYENDTRKFYFKGLRITQTSNLGNWNNIPAGVALSPNGGEMFFIGNYHYSQGQFQCRASSDGSYISGIGISETVIDIGTTEDFSINITNFGFNFNSLGQDYQSWTGAYFLNVNGGTISHAKDNKVTPQGNYNQIPICTNEIITAEGLNYLKNAIITLYNNRPLLTSAQRQKAGTALDNSNDYYFTENDNNINKIGDLINACLVINDIPNLRTTDFINNNNDSVHSNEKIFGDGKAINIYDDWLTDDMLNAELTSSNHNCRGACVGICSGGCTQTVKAGCGLGECMNSCDSSCINGCATDCTSGCYGSAIGGTYT